MTREEALAYAISQKAGLESELHRTPCGYGNWAVYSTVLDFINAAISALKGPTREQVEKMRGEWEWFDETVGTPIDGYEREWGWRCSKCKTVLPDEFDNPDDSPAMRFCQWCGAPMTDEAVDMVMERLEALYEET